jgi:hypothetical protein
MPGSANGSPGAGNGSLEAVVARRFGRLREQAEALLSAADPGKAFLGFFRYLVADAPLA